MAYQKRLGVFVKEPVAGEVKTRLVPPLTHSGAERLYRAFLDDLFVRLTKIKKSHGVVFYAGGTGDFLRGPLPGRFETSPQEGADLGERLANAFDTLLADNGDASAVVIGSDSPDLPVQYIKRAFLKLKHKDVVLGPSSDGGYYLIGLKKPAPGLFDGVEWGGAKVLAQTLERVERLGLSLAILPLWYDVDTPESLAMLVSMIRARKLEKSARLPSTERVLSELLHIQV